MEEIFLEKKEEKDGIKNCIYLIINVLRYIKKNKKIFRRAPPQYKGLF